MQTLQSLSLSFYFMETKTTTDIRPGMTIRVHEKIKDVNAKGEERERIQIFEGIVLVHHGGTTPGATITVRKISEGVGVEKIYPLFSPIIEKIDVVKQAQVRQATLYYLRNYKKKLKIVKYPCGRGGTGIHVRLRGVCRKAWEFNSPRPHQKATSLWLCFSGRY